MKDKEDWRHDSNRHEGMHRPSGKRGSPGHGGGEGAGGLEGDGERWRRGRKFSSEDLQLMLLAQLEINASHGYELIRALETMSNGFYKPSPGMVYPALTYMEEVGFAMVDVEGNKKRYRLAEPGRAHLDAHRERLTLISKQLMHIARKMDWMRRAWAGQAEQDPAVANGEAPDDAWLPDFVAARLGLKHALLLRTDAPAAEQRRIAAILVDATRQIEAGSAGKDAEDPEGAERAEDAGKTGGRSSTHDSQ